MSAFNNILAVVDWSGDVEGHCNRVVELARHCGARLTIATAAPDLPGPISREGESLRRWAEQESQRRIRWLDDWLATRRGDLTLRRIELDKPPFLAVIRQVLSGEHDLVIKAAEDPDWSDRIFGSDDMHLLRKCPCPVWLTKAGKPQIRRILAAVKLREDSLESAKTRAAHEQLNQDLFQRALALATMHSAELHVVHAWEAPGESLMSGGFASVPRARITAYVDQVGQEHARLFDEFLQRMDGLPYPDSTVALQPRRHLIKGAAPAVIPALVREHRIDLVVMGTIGRAGVPGLLIGNTAEGILDQLQCSVLAIKPPGFVTPVR